MPKLFELIDPEAVRKLYGDGTKARDLKAGEVAKPGNLYRTPSSWFGRDWLSRDGTHTKRSALTSGRGLVGDRVIIHPGSSRPAWERNDDELHIEPEDLAPDKDTELRLEKPIWIRLQFDQRVPPEELASQPHFGRLTQEKREALGWTR